MTMCARRHMVIYVNNAFVSPKNNRKQNTKISVINFTLVENIFFGYEIFMLLPVL